MKSVPIGQALERFFAGRDYDRRQSLESVFDLWSEVVGTAEAAMARPLSLQDGVLTLAVANSTLASEVSFSQSHYLDRVNRYFGTPVARAIRVKVEPVKRGTPSRPAAGSPRDDAPGFDPDSIELATEERAWIEEVCREVRGTSARTSLRRALTVYVKRRKWQSSRLDPNRREPKP